MNINLIIYGFWTLINGIHDGFFKFYNLNGNKVIFSRYLLVLIFSILWFLYETLYKKKYKVNIRQLIEIFILSSTRGLSTFLALVFSLFQLENGSMVNSTAIFYSIVYFDYLFAHLLKLPKNHHINWNNFYFLIIIFIYYSINFNYKYYLYGLISSVFFSLSNNFFLITKKMDIFYKNKLFLSLDMMFFSISMIIISLLYFQNPFVNLFCIKEEFFNLFIISILGLIITLILYFLFFYENYSPSNKMANFDLLIGAILDKLLFNIYPSSINLFLILNILY